MSWVWIKRDVVLALHDEQIAEHGGLSGIRDVGMLDSALARPEQKAAYEEPTVSDLAASYAYGLAKNHPFCDGNKRTALVCMELFLVLNGYDLTISETECVTITLQLDAGDISEQELSQRLKDKIVKH